MPMHPEENRVVRVGPDGVLYQWSNSISQPAGGGWSRVSKSLFPRVTKYLWYRNADWIKTDRENAKKNAERDAKKAQNLGIIDKLWLALDKSMHKVPTEPTKHNFTSDERVLFNNSVYYVKSANTLDGGIKIQNGITGEEKTVNAAELSALDEPPPAFDLNQRVTLALGAVHPTQEMDGVIVGFEDGKYKINIAAKGKDDIRPADPIVSVFPEAINAVVHDTEDVKAAKLALAEHGTYFNDSVDKRIVDVIATAAEERRSSITVPEVKNTLNALGMKDISDTTIRRVLRELNTVQPNIQYNNNTGSIYIADAYSTLKMLRKERNITRHARLSTLKNIVADNPMEMYAHSNQEVMLPGGAPGLIKNINGNTATVQNKLGETVKVLLRDLFDFDTHKRLLPNPTSPSTFGNVNFKDPFWVIRDREWVRRFSPGDSVSLIPGLSTLSGRKIKRKVNAQVSSINRDGTVTVNVKVDGRNQSWALSPRQIIENKRFSDVTQLDDYLLAHKGSSYDRTFYINNTAVSFGSNPGRSGGKGSVNITFADGNDYNSKEHLFFSMGSLPSATRGGTSVMSGIGSWLSGAAPDKTMIPSKHLIGYIKKMYPGANTIRIWRDTKVPYGSVKAITSPVTVKVSINSGDTPGRDISMTELLTAVSEPEGVKDIPGTQIGDMSSIKIIADGTGGLVVKIGDYWKKYTADGLPKLKDKKGKVPGSGINAGPTFNDVVSTPSYIKRMKWGAIRNSDELIDHSSIFTYDRLNDVYRVDLSFYDKARKFISSFFGPEVFNRHVFESDDGGYFAPASAKFLKDAAKKAASEQREAEFYKKESKPIPPEELDGMSKSIILRKYQVAGSNFATDKATALLAMDQGTGKTLTAIATAVRKLNRLNTDNPDIKHKVLIVAPANVAKTSWMDDLKKAVGPGKKYGYALLMGPNRIENYKKLLNRNDNTSIAVTSYETFNASDFKELKAIGFDMVILDEAQNITGEGIIGVRLRSMLDDTEHKLALTGTPIENKAEDIQAILGWLQPETFGNAEQFKSDFIEPDIMETYDAMGRKKLRTVGIMLKNHEALRRKLGAIMYRVDKSELLNNPDFLENIGAFRNVITVEELPAALNRYIKLKEKYLRLRSANAPKQQILNAKTALSRFGSISVMPKRIVQPEYSIKERDGKIVLDFPNGEPLTMDNYPEYKRMLRIAKERIREKFLIDMANGKRPNYNTAFITMQKVMNDPSIAASVLGPDFNIAVPNPKMDRLEQLILEHFPNGNFKSSENGKIIIFSYLTNKTIDFIEKELYKRFPSLEGRVLKYIGKTRREEMGFKDIKADNLRKALQQKFNNDPNYNYPIMLANVAAKTGVNLYAANMVIHYDLGWNPQDTNQRIDRAHRVRSLASVAKDYTGLYHKQLIPARNVYSYALPVVSRDGDINATVESRKLAVHYAKNEIFNSVISGQQQSSVRSVPTNRNHIGEEFFNVSNPFGVNRTHGESGTY